MTTTGWDCQVWEYRLGDQVWKVEAPTGSTPPSARDGFQVEMWWSPDRGQYFAWGKQEHFGITGSPHTTLTRTTPDGEQVEIDEKLVDYIEHLWEHGIRTTASCQGDPNGGDPETGGMPGAWGYISVATQSADKAKPLIESFGFDHLVQDDREREGKFTVWRFKGLT